MQNTSHETLGPCGCVDYHMADCPIRTASRDDSGPVEDLDYDVEDTY